MKSLRRLLRMTKLEIRVQGIVIVDDRILLARHVKRGSRYWVLPGGHRDPGETLEEGLAREFEEEVGIRPTRATLFSVSEVLLESREVLDIVFHVAGFRGRPRLGAVPADLPDRRLEAIAFQPVETLPTLTFRPQALSAEIVSAWEGGDWASARYLGNLRGREPRRRSG